MDCGIIVALDKQETGSVEEFAVEHVAEILLIPSDSRKASICSRVNDIDFAFCIYIKCTYHPVDVSKYQLQRTPKVLPSVTPSKIFKSQSCVYRPVVHSYTNKLVIGQPAYDKDHHCNSMTEKGKPSTISSEEKEISEETSIRICAHMNDDHAVSVYAMAKRKVEMPGKNWSISNAFIKKVTMQGCDIQVILCHKTLCQDAKIFYPFLPPLDTPTQIRSRIIAVHHQVCTPFKIFTDPKFFMIAGFFAASAWCTLLGGAINMEPQLAFGLKCGFYGILFAHGSLAAYGAHLGRKQLKLQMKGIVAWYTAIILAGALAFLELLELLEVDRKCKSSRKENKGH